MNSIIHKNTGLKLSQFGFGNWLTSSKFSAAEFLKAIKMLADNQINWIDTADSYDSGRAEERLALALRKTGLTNLFFVSTKVFFPVGEPNYLDKTLSRKKIYNAIESSLKRLKVGQIDLVYLHRDDNITPIEEIASTMNNLCTQGKICYWGVSRWSLKRLQNLVNFCKTNNIQGPSFYQDVYNLLNRDYDFEFYKQLSLSFIGYSILARGVLTNKYSLEEPPEKNTRLQEYPQYIYDFTSGNLNRVKKIVLMAKDLNISTLDVVFQYYKHSQEIQGYLFGASNLQQLESNLKSISKSLNVSENFLFNINK